MPFRRRGGGGDAGLVLLRENVPMGLLERYFQDIFSPHVDGAARNPELKQYMEYYRQASGLVRLILFGGDKIPPTLLTPLTPGKSWRTVLSNLLNALVKIGNTAAMTWFHVSKIKEECPQSSSECRARLFDAFARAYEMATTVFPLAVNELSIFLLVMVGMAMLTPGNRVRENIAGKDIAIIPQFFKHVVTGDAVIRENGGGGND